MVRPRGPRQRPGAGHGPAAPPRVRGVGPAAAGRAGGGAHGVRVRGRPVRANAPRRRRRGGGGRGHRRAWGVSGRGGRDGVGGEPGGPAGDGGGRRQRPGGAAALRGPGALPGPGGRGRGLTPRAAPAGLPVTGGPVGPWCMQCFPGLRVGAGGAGAGSRGASRQRLWARPAYACTSLAAPITSLFLPNTSLAEVPRENLGASPLG